MPKSKTASLTVALSQQTDKDRSIGSPDSDGEFARFGQTGLRSDGRSDISYATPSLSLPQSPSSPKSQSKGFFSAYRSSRLAKGRGSDFTPGRLPFAASTNNLVIPSSQPPARPVSPLPKIDTLSVSDRSAPSGSAASEQEQTEAEWAADNLPRADADYLSQRRPSRHALHQFVNRSRSTKTPDPRQPTRPSTGRRYLEPPLPEEQLHNSPRTAPLDMDRSYREAMGSTSRNKSSDRTTLGSKEGSEFRPSSSWESAGLLSNIKNTSTGIGRAGKGFFGRLTRAGSGNDREITDENYQFRVITLPLVEQTRRTRIRSRIEDAKDKTEYWMPALPYRCIDYLNLKGVEEEGLYRIPGSGREIRQWQTRFDTELDVNLLDEQELYDINIIGSMLKAWLRELPDELFPKSIQSRIAMECAGAKETPQMMKDELSRLPPYNYYLLFAITCHIAILHSHSEKNKMNYQNLCICFQPCMGIEGFCFYFLVCDWRNCWQGCWTETDHYIIEEESRPMELPLSSAGHSVTASHASDDLPFSATPGSRPATGGRGSSGSSERRPPPTIMTRDGIQGWEENHPPLPPRSRLAPGRTTPPTLSPLASVSPMRL